MPRAFCGAPLDHTATATAPFRRLGLARARGQRFLPAPAPHSKRRRDVLSA